MERLVFVEKLRKSGVCGVNCPEICPQSFVMLQRRARISRDDYKPLTLETNLKSGKWTLAMSVKRHGFIDILENGERVGLVMCVACSMVCSKNSFRKIRTHECQQSNHDDSDQLLTSSKTQRILERIAHTRQHPQAADSASEDSLPAHSSSSLFPSMSSMSPEPLNLSEVLHNNGFKMEMDGSKSPSPQPESIENVLSKMVTNINSTLASDKQSPSISNPTKTRHFNPYPSKQRSTQFLSKHTNKTLSVASSSNVSSSSGLPQNDGDIIGTMVNSTYRTLSAQNRRLAIEFKCCIMNVITEYEMLMLGKEDNAKED